MADRAEGIDPFDLDAQMRATVDENSKAREIRRREVEDFKWLMAHPAGRRIVWRLLERAGVYRTTFTGNSETFFKEGMRAMGLFIIGEVHSVTPEAYVTMLKEQRTNDE